MSAGTVAREQERRLKWDAAVGQFALVTPSGKGGAKPAAFIKGPLPLAWIQSAACQPGKTLQVALALWYLSGLSKSLTVRLPSKPLAGMGVSRDAKYEALARLESAGLVTVQRRSGQAPVVSLRVD